MLQIQSLPGSSAASGAADSHRASLRHACREFESLFLNMILKKMDQGVERNSLFSGGAGEAMFRDMLFEQYGNKMAEARQLGLAEQLETEMARRYQLPDTEGESSTPITQITRKMRLKKLEQYQQQQSSIEDQILHSRLKPFKESVQDAAKKFNLPPQLIQAVIMTESGGNPNAVSPSGAQGLMQIMPDTAKWLSLENPFNPHENILKGSEYLAKLLDQFDHKLDLALAAYNAGPTRVKEYGGVPPFQETVRYVEKVQSYQKKLTLSRMDQGLAFDQSVD